MTVGTNADQLLGRMELMPEYRQHVHPRMRLALQENQNVIAIHFDTDSLFGSNRIGFMRNLLQHGSEAKKFS